MIVYQVSIEVDPAIATAYRAWLGQHVREILALPGFVAAEILAVEGGADGSNARPAWCVQYRLRDRAALQAYFDQHAARLRADGVQRFGAGFRAQRQILEIEPLTA